MIMRTTEVTICKDTAMAIEMLIMILNDLKDVLLIITQDAAVTAKPVHE